MLLFSLVPCAEDCEQLWCYQPWNTFGNSVSQTHSLFTWKWKQIVCSSFNIAVVCKAWGWTYSCILLLSRSVMSESLQPRGLQHSRLACPSPSSKLAQTHVRWISDAIEPSRPLSSPSPPAFNLSQNQGLFQWISSLHQVAKVLEFQLQHQSFQYLGLISFRIDWFDLLAVQGTLKSLL